MSALGGILGAVANYFVPGSGAVVSKLANGGGGGGAQVQILGLRHPAIDQTKLVNDPLYAYAALMTNNGYKSMTGTDLPSNGDSAAISAEVNRHYAELRAQYGAVVPVGIYQAVGMTPPGMQVINDQGAVTMSSSTDLRDQLKAALLPIVANAAGLTLPTSGSSPYALPASTPPFNASAGTPGMVLQPAGLPAAAGSILSALGRAVGVGGTAAALTAGGGALAIAAGVVRAASGRIRGVMTAAGKFISSKRALELAKKVGLEAAAVALGIGAADMASMVLDQGTKAKRSRGISAADLRRTGRTMRKLNHFHRLMVQSCSSSGFRHHRAAKRCR